MNEYVISSHTSLGMWLPIQAEIKVNLCQRKKEGGGGGGGGGGGALVKL